MLVLSNSSPLVYLAKLGKLGLLRTLYNRIIVPEAVLSELRAGTEHPELSILEQAVNEGWVTAKESGMHVRAPGLGKGEIALINLAKDLKPGLVLVDDASARKIMESFGFNVKGTLYVLLLAYKKKIIAKNEAKRLVDELIVAGFRISTEIYSTVMKELE
ncbi:MAG: DUF3368 domain-containing protein [Candidatus Aenigmarchaeota archaeon]|nr:DUF3368 domain-containing protein [Candidatus Aenigmarchaeota archaeon]